MYRKEMKKILLYNVFIGILSTWCIHGDIVGSIKYKATQQSTTEYGTIYYTMSQCNATPCTLVQ